MKTQETKKLGKSSSRKMAICHWGTEVFGQALGSDQFERLRVERSDHINACFPRRCRNDLSLAFGGPTVAQFGGHGGVCGIQKKDDFPLGQVVFEVAVFVDEFGLSLRVSFGGCRLAFLEGEAVAFEPIRHAREGELDAQKTFGFSTAVCAVGTSQVTKIARNRSACSWVNLPSEPPLEPPVLSLSQ